MNIFEGARRVAIAGAAVVVVFVLYITVTRDPYAEISYEVSHFGATPILVDNCAYSSVDARVSESRNTGSGAKYDIEICFKASRSNDGRMLVPFVSTSEGVLMNPPYSEEVSEYTNSFIKSFHGGAAELALADERISRSFWSNVINTAVGIVVSLAGFWVFVWAMGWIMRGFLGIPRGQDKK